MVLMILYGIGRNNEINSTFVSKLSSQIRKYEDLKIIYLYNKVEHIYNPRSKEDILPPKVNKNDFQNDEFKVYNEVELISGSTLSFLKNYNDIYDDNLISYKNLICQLNLLKKGTKTVVFEDYKKIIFLRDDVFLSKKINLKTLFKIDDYSFLPFWSWFHGYNDRFFITNSKGAMVYVNRLDNVRGFVIKHGFLQGERLLKFSLNKENIKVLPLITKALRIRANGIIVQENNFFSFLFTKNLLELIFKLVFSKFLFLLKNWK